MVFLGDDDEFGAGNLSGEVTAFVDAFNRSDGAIGNGWSGATWTLTGNIAGNSPTLGPEKLTDGGLEAAYTAGKCNTLAKVGSPTLVQSADVRPGTSGSKAQQFTGTGFNDQARFPPFTPTIQTLYLYTAWVKRTAGVAANTLLRVYQNDQGDLAIVEPNWTLRRLVIMTPDIGSFFAYPAVEGGSGPFDTVITDDCSCKALTLTSIFTFRPPGNPDGVVKVLLSETDSVWTSGVPADGSWTGVVVRADSPTNPQNFIFAFVLRGWANAWVRVFEVVGGVFHEILTYTLLAHAKPAWLELRFSGTTMQVWYNNAQVGVDFTCDNALIHNRYHGMGSTGGLAIARFFMGVHLGTNAVGFMGSSITNAATGSGGTLPSYRVQVQRAYDAAFPAYTWSFFNSAVSGTSSWNNAVRLQADLLSKSPAPQVIIMDTANDDDDNRSKSSLEGWLRRAIAGFPTAHFIIILFPKVTDQTDDASIVTPLNAGALQNTRDLCNHYGIPYIDYDAAVRDLVVNHGHHLTEYFNDTIHPNDGGHALVYSMILPYLVLGGNAPAALPPWLYDSEYGYAPVIKNGTDYDSKTGVWTEVGGEITSSEVGATVTFSGTFKSVGCYQTGGGVNPTVSCSIDGGPNADIVLYGNGWEVTTRGAHTVKFTVKSGTVKITKFWAI